MAGGMPVPKAFLPLFCCCPCLIPSEPVAVNQMWSVIGVSDAGCSRSGLLLKPARLQSREVKQEGPSQLLADVHAENHFACHRAGELNFAFKVWLDQATTQSHNSCSGRGQYG